MRTATFVPLTTYHEYPVEDQRRRAREFLTELERRRTVRQLSDRPVPRDVIEECLRAAGSAPSGANMQPWHFVAVSDPAVKRRIREAAEEAERRVYATAPADWLDALAALGTDEHKPYLETAPYLIVVSHNATVRNRAARG